MVLEKDSSILGYPGEISQPLNADHHDVCKFSSREDPNYISLRSVLKTLISSFLETSTYASLIYSCPHQYGHSSSLFNINALRVF